MKKLLQEGISDPEFYDDLHVVYRLRKCVGKSIFFSEELRKLINPYKIRYNLHIMRQNACLVVNPMTANCTAAARTSDSMMVSYDSSLFYHDGDKFDLCVFIMMQRLS